MENIASIETKKNKRKGGRPRLIAEERRAFSIRPGFNEHEFSTLENRAEIAGLDLCEFVRRLALNQQFLAVPQINRQALAELSKIGTNLNQIAKVANSTQTVDPLVSASINLAKIELEKITLSLTVNESE